MDPTLVQYAIFVLAALILIGLVIALNKRLSRFNRLNAAARHQWVELDTRRADAREEEPPVSAEDDEEEEAEIHARARQNGHQAESQKPQL